MIVARIVTISRTKMTGFLARVRGSSLAKAEPIAGRTILGSVSAVTGICLRKRDVSIEMTPKCVRLEQLTRHHGEVLDDRSKRERREERETAHDENDADHKADEEAAMGREGAR